MRAGSTSSREDASGKKQASSGPETKVSGYPQLPNLGLVREVLLQIKQLFCPESGFILEKLPEETEGTIKGITEAVEHTGDALKDKGEGECVPK